MLNAATDRPKEAPAREGGAPRPDALVCGELHLALPVHSDAWPALCCRKCHHPLAVASTPLLPQVELVAGDTLPGPGLWAATTATAKLGPGDSHRGAVAAGLVEALRSPEAAGRDFSVKAAEGRQFPTDDEWARMFRDAIR